MRRKLLPIAFLMLASMFVAAQRAGRITGLVLNEDGQTADHATVCTSMKSGSSTTINCQFPANTHGEFEIGNVAFGSYALFAIDEGDGYSIENQSPGQQVKVTAVNLSPNVTIRMRPRGGILTGAVKDKLSGKSLGTAWVQWISIDDGSGGGSARTLDGKFQMAVPINSDLLVLVTANGYKGWIYTDALNSTHPVPRLASGERKLLDVELEPLPKP